MRILGVIFLTLIVAVGLWLALRRDIALQAASTATLAAPVAAEAPSYLDVTGTIDYYPNNVGTEVPYLVYKTADGATATKVLTFDDASVCTTSSGNYPCALIASALSIYYGAGPIRAVGTVDAENLLVDSISIP